MLMLLRSAYNYKKGQFITGDKEFDALIKEPGFKVSICRLNYSHKNLNGKTFELLLKANTAKEVTDILEILVSA